VRHDLSLEGRAFRLRPIEPADAAFVLELRTDARAGGRLHPVSGLLEDQVAWIEDYLRRPDDWYWVVERSSDGRPEGTLGLYDLDRTRGAAEWGRWIVRAGSLAAPESALLLYCAAFERLALTEVRCRTVATNGAVLSFHDRAGLERAGVVPGAFVLGGSVVDAVEHRLTRDRWPITRDLLEERSVQVAQILARGSH
jgi:RimJ/RimL family protein N-acetyltransferase